MYCITVSVLDLNPVSEKFNIKVNLLPFTMQPKTKNYDHAVVDGKYV